MIFYDESELVKKWLMILLVNDMTENMKDDGRYNIMKYRILLMKSDRRNDDSSFIMSINSMKKIWLLKASEYKTG